MSRFEPFTEMERHIIVKALYLQAAMLAKNAAEGIAESAVVRAVELPHILKLIDENREMDGERPGEGLEDDIAGSLAAIDQQAAMARDWLKKQGLHVPYEDDDGENRFENSILSL